MKPYRNKKIGEYIRSGAVACCITGSTYAVVNLFDFDLPDWVLTEMERLAYV
jgi:hypothetical protein